MNNLIIVWAFCFVEIKSDCNICAWSVMPSLVNFANNIPTTDPDYQQIQNLKTEIKRKDRNQNISIITSQPYSLCRIQLNTAILMKFWRERVQKYFHLALVLSLTWHYFFCFCFRVYFMLFLQKDFMDKKQDAGQAPVV